MEKSTSELASQLLQSSSLEKFQRDNAQELNHPSALEYYTTLLQQHHFKNKSQAFDLTQYNSTYLYSVFRKERPLNRNLCRALALAIGCSLEETQTLLKYAGLAQLYPRNQRDMLIIFALNKGYSVPQLNNLLSANQEPLLGEAEKADK